MKTKTETTGITGLDRGYIGLHRGYVYWDDGKENGNYYVTIVYILGVVKLGVIEREGPHKRNILRL